MDSCYFSETNDMTLDKYEKDQLVYPTCRLKRQPCQVFIDCGSRKNYILTRIVNQLGIKMNVIKRKNIYLTDN